MSTVAERWEVLKQKRGELAAIFEKGRVIDPDGKRSTYQLDAAALAEVRTRNEELAGLHDAWLAVRDSEEMAASNARELQELERLGQPMRPEFEKADDQVRRGGGVARPEQKAIGTQFIEHAVFKQWQGGEFHGKVSLPGFDLKALFSTTAGWAIEDLRTGRVVLDEQEEATIVDILPLGRTRMANVVYMEETTFTNPAAETAEGGTYPEAALALTEKTSPVRKIPVSLPVTDEQLEDEERVEDYLNGRLRFMLLQRLALQVIAGNGTAPNLRGVNNVTGINTQAKGADPTPDAVYRAMTKGRVNGFTAPSHSIWHPNDWQDVRLLRTADGIYIWGSPTETGPPRIWGLPVLQTTHQTENTATVGDFRKFSELVLRRGIEFSMTDSHSTFFTEGKKMIRADFRAALIYLRALAFSTVTGI